MVSNEKNSFKKVKLAGPHCVNGLLSALKSTVFPFLGVQSSGRLEFISGIVLHQNQLYMFKIVLLMLF